MENLTRGSDQRDLPTKFIIDKLETTRIYEDPEDINQFSRRSLKDTSAAPPLFAEEDRRKVDTRTILNLRMEGAPCADMPYHPDTFLDEHISDTRGADNQPDWKEYNRQRRARGKFIKFYNDSDNSIHEGYVGPGEIGEKKQALLRDAKRKMNWFSTSKDGRATSAGVGVKLKSDLNYVVAEDFTEDLETRQLHRNYTVALSNMLPIGWYSTTDHEFAVARYGPTPRNHYVQGDEIMGKHAGLVEDNAKESMSAENMKQAIIAMHSATEYNRNVIAEVGNSAYTEIAETQNPMIRKQIQKYVAADIHSTEMDHCVVESMTAAIGNNNIGKGNEAVRAVVSFSDKQLQVDAENREGFTPKQPVRLITESDMKDKQEFRVMDYRGMLPQINTSHHKVKVVNQKITGENFESHENLVYKGSEPMRLTRPEFAGDTRVREFGHIRRSVGRPEKTNYTRSLALEGSTSELYGVGYDEMRLYNSANRFAPPGGSARAEAAF